MLAAFSACRAGKLDVDSASPKRTRRGNAGLADAAAVVKDTARKIWRQRGRCARSSGVLCVLCPRSLNLLFVEGICGRFGRIGVKTDTYRALRLIAARWLTDDGVESFTVCGFLLLR